jgi:hypothetical protein
MIDIEEHKEPLFVDTIVLLQGMRIAHRYNRYTFDEHPDHHSGCGSWGRSINSTSRGVLLLDTFSKWRF